MKVILIISGGMDSTTLLYDLKNRGHEIKALSFNYGQRHKKEISYAKRSCRKLGVPHCVVNLSAISKLISNSALTGNIDVPEGHYQSKNMKVTIVPNRNMIMLSIAIGYAENLQYDCVAIANHAGDHYIYPDCRPEFIEILNNASNLGTVNHIKIYAPYTNITKTDISKIGATLGINYSTDTWTCYKGEENPCGKCGSCIEREEALQGIKEGGDR